MTYNITSVVNCPSDEIITKTELEASYVPYTGATTNLNLGLYSLFTGDASITGALYTPTINGGTGANDDITIQGTTHATRTTSYVILQPNGGNVGIGTTTPTAKLDVLTGANTVGLNISGSSGQVSDYINVKDDNGTSVFSLDKMGNITMQNPTQSVLTLALKNTIGEAGTDESLVEVWGQNRAMFIGKNNAGTQLFNMGYNSNLGGVAVIGYGGGSSIRMNSSHQTTIGSGISDFIGQATIVSGESTRIAQVVKGAVSQTANLTEWRDSDNNVLSVIDASGNVGIGTTTPGSKLTLGSGQVELPAGTVSAPAITNTGALNTGIYFPTAGTMAFSSNGTVMLNMNSANGYINTTTMLASSAFIIGSSANTRLYSGGVGVLNMSYTTNPNSMWLQNTYTDTSNYERATIGWVENANVFSIQTQALGSGTLRNIALMGGNVGVGTTTPNANALLDITSTTKAFLPPRMTTTQKNAISSPTGGMIVYDTTLSKLCVYGASSWETITSV